MKKGLILLSLLFLITGCDATYEFSINNGILKEKLNVIETNKALFDVQNDAGWTLREVFDSVTYSDEFSDEMYKIKTLSDDEHLEVEFSSDGFDTLGNSSILNQCYTNPSIIIKDQIVTIETGNEFTCYEYYENLNEIEVRFETNHEVILTNADLEEDGTYIWYIGENSDKNILISYDQSIVHNKYKNIIIIGIVSLAIILLFSIFMIVRKSKRENRI